MASSVMMGNVSVKPCPRVSPQAMSWNPLVNLAISKCKKEISFLGNKTRVQCHNRTPRNSFVVYANTVPGAPSPSPAGSPSSNPMSWVLGLVVSFILPFFTNKWGPLWVVKDRIVNAVQTVENIVEAVEEVAGKVDKVADDIIDDLPQGKLRDLVELVEDAAEATAKTADSLDNVIDKVQEAGDHVEDIVETAVKEAKTSPTGAN